MPAMWAIRKKLPLHSAASLSGAASDILVNNAGISQIGNVEATPEDAFDRIMCVNVKGYYNCIHASIGT